MDTDSTKSAQNSPNTDNVDSGSPSLSGRQKTDFLTDLEAHDEYIVDFDSYEAMLISRTYDAVSRETKSGITDGSTTTISLERAARVVGQLPEGSYQAAGKKDAGKACLLDITRQKYFIPNMNAQWPYLTKLRMWDFYSSVYGFMPMFVDWEVKTDGYMGPQCWLWNPRNFIPQNGKTNIRDMDYCHAFAFVTASYLQDLLDEEDGDWDKDTVEKLIKWAEQNSLWNDVKRDTYVKRVRTFQAVRGEIPLVTRYEAGDGGHWVTFCPWFGYSVLRDIPNPHKTDRLPWFIKPGIPLFDSFYGLGDFQRARPLQFAKDGLTNFYFEGLKMNIYPPTVVNINGIVKSSIDQRPGSIWMENIPNSVRRLETSTAGLSTYTAAITQLQAAMQSQAGVTDTMTSAESSADPTVGKTPAALNMVNQRMNTRDAQDTFYLEQEVQDMEQYMMQLFINIGTETVDLSMFSEDIQDIVQAGYQDVTSALEVSKSGQSAKLRIKPSQFKDLEVKFQIKTGSMKQVTNAEKAEALNEWFSTINKMQNELQVIRNQGEQINWKLLFDQYGQVIGVPEMSKMWIPVSSQEMQQEQQAQQAEAQAQEQPHVVYKMNGNLNAPEIGQVMDASGIQVPPQMSQGAPQSGLVPGGVQPDAPAPQPTQQPQIDLSPIEQHLNHPDPQVAQAAANMRQIVLNHMQGRQQ